MRRNYNNFDNDMENSWGFNFSRFTSNGWSNLNLYEASHDPSILTLNIQSPQNMQPNLQNNMSLGSMPLMNQPPHPSNALFKCIENDNSQQQEIRQVSYIMDNQPQTKIVNHKQYFRIMKRRIKKVLSKYPSQLVLIPQNLNQSGGNNFQNQSESQIEGYCNQNITENENFLTVQNLNKSMPNLIYVTSNNGKNYTLNSESRANTNNDHETPIKVQNFKKQMNTNQSINNKKYKYESRHKHAKARQRDKNGKFIATRSQQQRFRQKGKRGRKPKNAKNNDATQLISASHLIVKIKSSKKMIKKKTQKEQLNQSLS